MNHTLFMENASHGMLNPLSTPVKKLMACNSWQQKSTRITG